MYFSKKENKYFLKKKKKFMSRFKCIIFLKRRIRDNEKWQMSTIKNGQILLYCHFNKKIKEPGISFQSPGLSQKTS